MINREWKCKRRKLWLGPAQRTWKIWAGKQAVAPDMVAFLIEVCHCTTHCTALDSKVRTQNKNTHVMEWNDDDVLAVVTADMLVFRRRHM